MVELLCWVGCIFIGYVGMYINVVVVYGGCYELCDVFCFFLVEEVEKGISLVDLV